MSIELEVTPEAILGQLLPPQAGLVTARTRAGDVIEVAADRFGFFAIRPVPAGSFQLRCRTDSGGDVLTGWITP